MEDRAERRDPLTRARRRRRWVVAPSVLLVWVVLTVADVIPGCLVPPVIMPGGEKSLGKAIGRAPSGTEAVEIPLENGERLRGVFVPSAEGAPVVLHFLESSGSVTSEMLDYDDLLEELASAGFASLMVDYRGVGASDGDRTPRHFEEDARAMWTEALRRAGGDPGRVVVRAISIGAIPMAIVAQSDVHPAAWILIAPVRAETVVRRFAAWQYPGLLGQMASAFFHAAADADLIAAVHEIHEPMWVVSPENDVLLAHDEQVLLREAVEAAGGRWTVSDSGHEFTTLGAHSVWAPEEADLLATLIEGWPDRTARAIALLEQLPPDVVARFPAGSEQRSRLAEISIRAGPASPVALAAAALAFADPNKATDLVRRNARRKGDWLYGLRFEELEHILDLRDPAGEIPIESLRPWVGEFRILRSQGAVCSHLLAPEAVLELLRRSESEAAEGQNGFHEFPLQAGSGSSLYPCCELWKAMGRGSDLPSSAVRRRAARVLLKAAAIPERVVTDGDGTSHLEIQEGGEWRTIALDWPEPLAPAAREGVAAESR